MNCRLFLQVSIVLLAALLGSLPAAGAAPFVVNESDFVDGVYTFQYFTFPNTAPHPVSKRTVINGVDKGIIDPTMSKSGWEFGDSFDQNVGYWAALGPSQALLTSGAATMGWDFSGVTSRIVKVELKTRHVLAQLQPHTAAAQGDEIAGFVATPPAFGAGGFKQIYSFVGNGDPNVSAFDQGNILDITSLLPGAWLEDPKLLEMLFTYSQTPNPTIPGGFIQLFRDNSGQGEDGFLFRVTLVSTQGPPAVTLDGPASGLPGALLHFEATGTNCNSAALPGGWEWDTAGATVHGYSNARAIVLSWNTPGTRTVSASHPSCSSASASKQLVIEAGAPRVQLSTSAVYMDQPAGTSLGSASYSINNYGEQPTTLTLESDAEFFTQSPGTVTIAPGTWQQIEVKAQNVPEGLYRKRSFFSGSGLSQALIENGLLVQLLASSTEPTNGQAAPQAGRIDVTGEGSAATFRNTGTLPLEAQVIVTQPWIVPVQDRVTIPPGAELAVAFALDPERRPNATVGSVTGEIGLRYSTTANAAKPPRIDTEGTGTGTVSTSLVTVVYTVPPPVSAGEIPALSPGVVALFVPGMGHLVDTIGRSVSDLAMVNLLRTESLNDLLLYFNPQPGSPGAGSQLASIATLLPNQSVVFGDLVRSVFRHTAQVGSLQIRSTDINALGVNATIFNATNPEGTVGTDIPVIRSDRGAGPGERIWLTGLRRDATHETTLYLQEMSGSAASVRTDFLGAAGNVISTRTDPVPRFALVQLANAVPAGAVSARLTSAGEAGTFFAFATPFDALSGDPWVVSDWPRQLGYGHDEAMLVPVAGALRGTNATFFRTDLSILNTGTTAASGTLRYFDRNGTVHDQEISLGVGETKTYTDITTTLFGITAATAGHMIWTPESGEVVISSRNFTTADGSNAAFGSGVPTLAKDASLQPGDLIRFGGVEDSTGVTIRNGRPATFRTNFGLVETTGKTARVRITIRYEVQTGLTSTRTGGWREIDVPANGFLLVSNIARTVLGNERETTLGDLRNLEVDFELASGEGRVTVFTSSVDNGTGDSILRTKR